MTTTNLVGLDGGRHVDWNNKIVRTGTTGTFATRPGFSRTTAVRLVLVLRNCIKALAGIRPSRRGIAPQETRTHRRQTYRHLVTICGLFFFATDDVVFIVDTWLLRSTAVQAYRNTSTAIVRTAGYRERLLTYSICSMHT